MRFFFLIAAGLACSIPALAEPQDAFYSTATGANSNVIQGTMGFPGRRFAGTPVTGAPYSAQRVSEHVQIGTDGTRFTQTNQQETIYRDSQGRTRTERQTMMGRSGAQSPVAVEIVDPIAGFSYTLDTQNKVAHRVQLQTPERQAARNGGNVLPSQMGVLIGGATETMRAGTIAAVVPPPPPPPPGAQVASRPLRPEMKQEDLGQQVIEGVVAAGHRMTQTWPEGSQGNDRPFQVVSETWMSADLKEMVLSKNTDPRSGENTAKLLNINRAEPDASLFMPPADYKVVDEAGPFQINWSAPRQ